MGLSLRDLAERSDVSAPMLSQVERGETSPTLAGVVALIVDGTRHELHTGDSVTFDADLPHHFENEGEEPTRFLAVIAAGLRRS